MTLRKGGPKLKKAVNTASPPVTDNAEKTLSASEDAGRGGEKLLISYNPPDGQQVNYKYEGSGMIMAGGSVGVMRTSRGANGTMRVELPKVTMAAFAEETLSHFWQLIVRWWIKPAGAPEVINTKFPDFIK